MGGRARTSPGPTIPPERVAVPFFEVLGWVAAAFGMSAAVPQLVHQWRSGSSAGLSIRLWQFNVAGTTAWTLHGFLVQRPQLQVPNIVCTLIFGGVLWFIARHRGLRFAPRLVLPVLMAAALFGIDWWLGAVAFGLLVSIPPVVGQWAQLRYMQRSPDLGGVSAASLAVMLSGQALWFVWGLGVGERAIIVAAGLLVLLCGANLGYYAWRVLRGTARGETLPECPAALA